MDCTAEAIPGPPDFPGVVLLPEVPDSFFFPSTQTDPGWRASTGGHDRRGNGIFFDGTFRLAQFEYVDDGTGGCIQCIHFAGRTLSAGRTQLSAEQLLYKPRDPQPPLIKSLKDEIDQLEIVLLCLYLRQLH